MTFRIMAIAALIATTGLALHVGQAQQAGARRISSRNVGASRAAELATYIVQEGKPPITSNSAPATMDGEGVSGRR